MLDEIIIQNFKAHEDTKIPFSDINIFIGPNNTGKTSATQIIQLLKQTDRYFGTRLFPERLLGGVWIEADSTFGNSRNPMSTKAEDSALFPNSGACSEEGYREQTEQREESAAHGDWILALGVYCKVHWWPTVVPLPRL